MGNASSVDEDELGRARRATSSGRGRRSSHRHTARSHAISSSSSDDEDWEIIDRRAPRQMPSQQYYPVPWIHRLDERLGEIGAHRRFSSRLATTARPRESSLQTIGQVVAVGTTVAVLKARAQYLAEQHRPARQEEQETLPEPSAPPAPHSPPLPTPVPRASRLPEVCRHHPGCSDTQCRRLHLCLLFLADVCHNGGHCHRGHTLTTEHNQWVCDIHGLDTRRELECLMKLSRACEESGRLPVSMLYDNLRICCSPACGEVCAKLHICRNFVAGDCTRPVCRFSHDLHSPHNNDVIRRHKMDGMADGDILVRLREKYPALMQQSTRGTGGRGRQQTSPAAAAAAGDDDPAAGGLCDELQCPVCLELLHTATTLGCGHTFCAGCVTAVERGQTRRCPLCRAAITSTTRSVTLDNIVASVAAKR